ncbi:MAG TPA: hypothetical protein VNC12_10980 [Solirubrobacteraceae bacterium]|nr:hypothetical protein [Solirubrobacteraceae bacterium]
MEANFDPRYQAPNAPAMPWTSSASAHDRASGFGDTLKRAKRAANAKRAQRTLMSVPAAPLDGPPPEVQREMLAAARVWQTLAAQGKELRFGQSADGRVSVELTDTSGRALDVIGPSGLFRLLQQAS